MCPPSAFVRAPVSGDMAPRPTLGVAQFEPTVGDVERNLATIGDLAAEATADVLVLPELAVTGYDLEAAREAAAPIPGPLTDALIEHAAHTGTWLVAGLPERDADEVYNVLALASPDGVEAVYRKQYPWAEEAAAFGVGGGPVTAETPVGTVGFLLCYDLNFPEASLAYAREPVDVLAVSAAWRTSYRADWRLLAQARALDSTCYVAASNHVGDQRGREHGGHSLLAAPTGDLAGETDESRGVVETVVSADELSQARERNPVLESRRTRSESDAS